jgi:hypothetical protein
VNSTISIDLSKSWTTNKNVVLRTTPRKSPAKANVALWTDTAEGAFYSWGGRFPQARNITEPELWKFTADGKGGGSWSRVEPENPTRFGDLHPTEDGAFANSPDTGFMIGGVAHAHTEVGYAAADALSGMVTFDMKTRTWQNGTTNFSPFGAGRLIHARAQYVPGFGDSGLVFVLGGYAPERDVNKGFGPAYGFENVTFFDPKTKQTYTQATTGDAPTSPRGQFCSAVFPTADGGQDM